MVYFAGIDLGTSGIKAGIIDSEGQILSQVVCDTRLTSSGPGKMEQDPEYFYSQTLKILKSAIEQAGVNSADIAGLAIDGQMGGIIGIDREFNSVTGLDMGLDTRSEKYNALLHREYRDAIASTTCGSPRNAPKMMMWAREFPDVYTKIHKFVTLGGYVTGRLAGLQGDDAFIDYTLLSFFGNEDAQKLKWSEELSEAFGIDTSKLPEVVDPWKVVGTLTNDAAGKTGLKKGMPIMAGAGDQPAGFLGLGFLNHGRVLDVSGSSTLLCCSVDSWKPDREDRAVMYMPSVVKGKYTAFTYINGGGITLKWFRDEIAAGLSWEQLTGKAELISPGSERLLFVPYFGGRQCPYSAELRGAWIGLNWGHKKEHMFRSLLEGLGYDYAVGLGQVRRLFPEIDIERIDGIGGGAKNRFWNQMKADILNVEYNQLGDYQFSLIGCAVIAGYSLGVFSGMEEKAASFNRNTAGTVFAPDVRRVKAYQPFLKMFRKVCNTSLERTMLNLFDEGGTE